MLEYTTARDGARLGMLLHDDAKREYAYNPAQDLAETRVGTFSQALFDEAKKKGWTHQHEERLETGLRLRGVGPIRQGAAQCREEYIDAGIRRFLIIAWVMTFSFFWRILMFRNTRGMGTEGGFRVPCIRQDPFERFPTLTGETAANGAFGYFNDFYTTGQFGKNHLGDLNKFLPPSLWRRPPPIRATNAMRRT